MQGIVIRSADEFFELVATMPFKYSASVQSVHSTLQHYIDDGTQVIAFATTRFGPDHYVYTTENNIKFTEIICMNEYRRMSDGKSTTTL